MTGDSGATRLPKRDWGVAGYERSGYAVCAAVVGNVEAGSRAWDCGLRQGMVVVSADGFSMTDVIDWFWIADGPSAVLGIIDDESDGIFEIEVPRESDGSWGFEFTENVFDGVRTCVNSCRFCFMSMLPPDMRRTLYIRDDDYRLSFLQGNFVTLTNMGEEDVKRVLDMRLSPLHVSLHALDPEVRSFLMGTNHARGLDVLRRLLDGGIEVHVQAVVVPGVNDGRVLDELMSFAVEEPGVLSAGIVPLGFTRFQSTFDHSFGDVDSARAVIELAKPHQARSKELWGTTGIQLADEFYLAAFPDDVEDHLPADSDYDGYPQFSDGIGMLRTLVDGWRSIDWENTLNSAREHGERYLLVCGTALEPLLSRLVKSSGTFDILEPLPVANDFFGGNVDVSGLLTAIDVIWAVRERLSAPDSPEITNVIIPTAMLNDDDLTLDGFSTAEIEAEIGAPLRVVCYSAWDLAGLLEARR